MQFGANTILEQFNFYAALALAERVKCADIFRKKAGIVYSDDTDISWFDEVRASAAAGALEDSGVGPKEVAAAQNYFEMECLVRAINSMETIASSEYIVQEYVIPTTTSQGEVKLTCRSSPAENVGRDFWSNIGREVKALKGYMRPILNNWLMESIQGKLSGIW